MEGQSTRHMKTVLRPGQLSSLIRGSVGNDVAGFDVGGCRNSRSVVSLLAGRNSRVVAPGQGLPRSHRVTPEATHDMFSQSITPLRNSSTLNMHGDALGSTDFLHSPRGSPAITERGNANIPLLGEARSDDELRTSPIPLGSTNNILARDITQPLQVEAMETGAIVNANPRGPSRGIAPQADPLKRVLCEVSSKRFLCGQARTKASNIMKHHISDSWIYFSEVDKCVKEGCWLEFKNCFRFRDGQEENVKKVFFHYLSKNYPNWLSRAREDAMTKAHTTRITDAIKDFNPPFILKSVWAGMVDKWKADKWLAKSKAGEKNRALLVSNHTGGSRPFEQHKVELREANGGKDPLLTTFWEKVHTKRSGEWISESAKNIATDYSAKVGDGEDDMAIWCEVNGGSKKRVRGFPDQNVQELLGEPMVEPTVTVTSSSQVLVDRETLQRMIDEGIANKLASAGIVQSENLNQTSTSPEVSCYRPTFDWE